MAKPPKKISVPFEPEEIVAVHKMAAVQQDLPAAGRMCQRLVRAALVKAGFLKDKEVAS